MPVSDFTLKGELGPPANPARIVRPRKPARARMSIAVCDAHGNAWWENEKGKKAAQWDIVELVRYLKDHWPRDAEGRQRNTAIMLVCHNPHRTFQRVHEAFKSDPEWNARFSVNSGDKFYISDGAAKEPKVRTTADIRISYFGFRDANRKTRYFHPISPHHFLDDFDTFGDPSWPEYIRLYQWGGSVRRWIRQNKLRFSPTRGGLSSQLLRDKRFYPKPRRKVPKASNENARPAMPGNFYAMRGDYVERKIAGVFLIDQMNAHHYAAETVDLPDANTLYARGRFATQSDKPFMREKRPGFDTLLSEHGLFRCRVQVPRHLMGMIPPWAQNPGLQNVYLFSNELDLVRELGVEIRHISYAWTSRDCDTGLKKYAQWAQGEVSRNLPHKPWLKPILLSAYGILGARPRIMEMAYWRSTGGEPFRYLLGPTPVTMNRTQTSKEIQPAIANTIHRGMIEAETRKLSVTLARKLESEGHTVIAIHADAVLIRDEGQQLPLLPPPWRVKDRLTAFQAIDQVSYRSDHVDILPGRKKSGKGKR